MKNSLITVKNDVGVNGRHCFAALLMALSLVSCTIIAPFDPFTLDESYAVKRDIAVLYQLLGETPPQQRQYAPFRRDYARIVASFDGLLERQQYRKNNEETTKIVEQIRTFFVKYRDAHKSKDSYKNAKIKLHSKRLNSLMKSLIMAEEAKRK